MPNPRQKPVSSVIAYSGNRNRQIMVIALPMMLSNMSVPLLGLVDTALLGHLESAAFLGAVALGANLINLAYWSFGFLRMGTTSLVARNAGASSTDHNADDEAGIMARSLLLAAALGLTISALLPYWIDDIVRLLNASDAVAPLAAEYLGIRLYSAPAVLLTYTVAGWLIGHRRASAALTIVLTTNIANIVLDAWFILGLGWQSAGAAWATLLAEYLGLLLALSFIRHEVSHYFQLGAKTIFQGKALRALLRGNFHLLIRTVLLLFVLNFFMAQGAKMGDITLAANAILFQLAMFAAYVMDGFSHAAEALCGRAIGAGRLGEFRQLVARCAVWTALSALAFSLIYALGGYWIAAWFSDIETVTDTARAYLIWLTLMPLVACLAYLLDGVFIGAGENRTLHFAMAISTAVFMLVWWLSLAWGNSGLWFAFLLFNLTRGLVLALLYQRKWYVSHSTNI